MTPEIRNSLDFMEISTRIVERGRIPYPPKTKRTKTMTIKDRPDTSLASELALLTKEMSAIKKRAEEIKAELFRRHPEFYIGQGNDLFKVTMRRSIVIDQEEIWKFLDKFKPLRPFFKVSVSTRHADKLKGLIPAYAEETVTPVLTLIGEQ